MLSESKRTPKARQSRGGGEDRSPNFPIPTKAQNPESVTLAISDQSACSAYGSHSTGLAWPLSPNPEFPARLSIHGMQ